jgi:hypothetical protein
VSETLFEEINNVSIPQPDVTPLQIIMQPVITHILCRYPRDGKMEGTLVLEARARDPTGRRQAVPLAKENFVLSPWPADLVLNPRTPRETQDSSRSLTRSSQAEAAVATRLCFEGRSPKFLGGRLRCERSGTASEKRDGLSKFPLRRRPQMPPILSSP